MKRQKNKDNNDDDEIIWVSKSEIKRDAEALKDLGSELVNLSKNVLERIPLDEELQAAIQLAQKIDKGAHRRQIQLIGKLLRKREIEPIQTALDKIKNRYNQEVFLFHKLESLRDDLIHKGDEAMPCVLALYPEIDRQQLRNFIRNAQKEKTTKKPAKASQHIFKCLREQAEKNQ